MGLNKLMIETYLTLLGDELAKENIQGRVLIAGGAALCLGYGMDGSTEDIDAIFEPANLIINIANKMSLERNLDLGWLNNGVAGYLEQDPPYIRYKKIKGLDIDLVAADYLLAMKISASRLDSDDFADTAYLSRFLALQSPDQALEIFKRYFPDRELSENARANLEAAFKGLKTGKSTS
ncbi:MAG: hypothetical protein LBT38_10350 [Deltaproteobacteria bacterium]|jgi:hypothetical protein|nr:hypothetical protein [Deltaproteobacteria bacterium]